MVFEQILNKKNICHDCRKEIKIEGEEIKNGVLLAYGNGQEKINIFKCQDCFAESKELKNYQPCEVYSRIVGYLRPVGQWNEGKKQEFRERKNYDVPKNYN
ncbi:MAG: anaerobic ribonucleoside-triphosphate reductase [bacterium]|nr:anaerobic ribonucleoside-triphosphate reductase [bacterium]